MSEILKYQSNYLIADLIGPTCLWGGTNLVTSYHIKYSARIQHRHQSVLERTKHLSLIFQATILRNTPGT